MTDPEYQEALVKESKSFSIIWLLPLIALGIGGWLVAKAFVEAPIEITISFPSATGMEVGKTKVMYEGITAGVVKDIQLDTEDLKGVMVTVEMDRRVEPVLRESTQFWLVKPEISLKGVTGLETIVSGNYIALKIGLTGKKTTFFEALSEPPAVDTQVPGLHLQLKANDLGSLHIDAPVLFKKIVVGSVTKYSLQADQDLVSLSIHIKPEYAHLVSKHTRFWNVSGIQVNADLSGVEFRSESLLSAVQGGITFDSPPIDDNNPPAQNLDTFPLFEDFETARRGLIAQITFPLNEKLKANKTKVMLRGFEVGEIKYLKFSDDKKHIIADVLFRPEVEEYLTDASRFWVVKPELSIKEVKGLDTLFTGAYVEMEYRAGQPSRVFTALAQAPKVDYSAPGLHLKLETDEMGSIARGTPILYRQVKVGEVKAVSLARDRKSVIADITIEEKYRKLVNSHSRFWNASGISITGSLTKVKFRAESLSSIVQGGIGFYNPDVPAGENVKAVGNGAMFQLYEDYELAQEEGILVRIHLKNGEGVEAGTLIKYQGYTIGEIKHLELKADLSGLVAQALIKEQAHRFAAQGSVYWLVKPRLGITGASNLDTLLKGQYFEVVPGNGKLNYDFTAKMQQPTQTTLANGLNIVLKAPRLHSVKKGLNIYYRDIVVGTVTDYKLGEMGNEVHIYANIRSPYDRLVRQGTQFWNASGVNIDVGIFSGASIKTESLESILAGGISFATPSNGNELAQAKQGAIFTLHKEWQEPWLNWAPSISLK